MITKQPLPSVRPSAALEATTVSPPTSAARSALLFLNSDFNEGDSISLFSSSPTLSSSRRSSSDDEEVDMCQLVEDGLLEDVVDSIDEGKAALATRILENIDELIDLEEWIKSEEPFANWLEDKNMITMMMMDSSVVSSPLPTYGEVIPEPVVPHTTATLSSPPPAATTHSLLREFESVFDSVEELGKQRQHEQQKITTVEQLTPPDSPHMAEVEALVRCRAEEQLGAAAPQLTVPPSPSNSSNYSSCYDDAMSTMSSDPDYPEPECIIKGNKAQRSSGRRKEPYSGQRNSEEKRSRKKEQNKNAATRYRQKKKAEVDEIAGEERELQHDNDQLHTDVADVQREIRYLKSLMRDLFRAKGLLQ